MIVRTADRTLQIFEVFAQRLKPLTLSELARLLDMPVSTCSNLLRTMQARGYLYEVGSRKAYYPTSRWLIKAMAIADADPVVEIVQPHLERLRDKVDETAMLGKRMGDKVVYLSVAESTKSIRYSGQPGDMNAMHSSPSGKAILAAMPLAERVETVSRLKMLREAPGTITRRKEFLADIAEGCKRGWWASRAESAVDLLAIASAINLQGGVYTVVIAGPASRLEPDLESIAQDILTTCEAITREF